jgi:putative membrane protein
VLAVGLPALVAALLYARRTATLRKQGRPVATWRQLCFAGGLLLGTGGLVALGGLGDERFAAHMAEHLLLGDLGALLIVLGLTGPVLQPLLRRAGWLRVFGHPVVAFSLWAVNLFAWHVPALHEAAVESAGVHALQHALFTGLGVAVWLPLFGPFPQPSWFGNVAKLLVILAVRLTGAVLANVLLWADEPLYDVYTVSDPLADQQLAAGLMMVEGSILTLVLFGWLFLRAAQESDEAQHLVELGADPQRAARAAAARRSAELQRRLEAER